MLAPVLEQLAGEFAGRLKFAKANVDETPDLAASFEVSGVPTLMLFRGGKAVDQVVGFSGLRQLKAWLEKAANTTVTAINMRRIMILRIIIGILVGGGLGFGWYKLVGCSTGTCPLTSNPVISTIFGAVFGALLATSFH